MSVADYPEFSQTIDRHFPGAISEPDFVSETATLLQARNFSQDNTIACVALCRDEIASPLFTEVERMWGSAFSLAGLAGMVTAGRTGLSAAIHHAPIEDGRRRFVIYAMAHIAIDTDGTIGRLTRSGISEQSSACGALVAFRGELEAGTLVVEFDRYDTEQSLLKHRLLPLVGYGNVPDLVDLTKLTAVTIKDDLRKILLTLASEWSDAESDMPADVAIFSGVQIHGPDATNFLWSLSNSIERDGNLSDYSFSSG